MSKLDLEDLKKAAGGSFNPKNAKVYSVDGSSFGIYDEPSDTAIPLVMLSSGTQLEVDPTMVPAMDFFPGSLLSGKTEDFYKVVYDYHVRIVKAKEVRIEWL